MLVTSKVLVEMELVADEFAKEVVMLVEMVTLVLLVVMLVRVVTMTLETTVCRLVVVQVKLDAVTTNPRLDMLRMKFVEGTPKSLPPDALKMSPFRPVGPVRLLLTTGFVKLALKRTMSLLKVLEFV